jgi:hypothetical protein
MKSLKAGWNCSKKARRKMIAYEQKKGKPPVLDVYWGDDFDLL